MSVLDKVRSLRKTLPQNDGGNRTTGIFKQWEKGPNQIRLVGEFLEVRTHFISPAPKRNERGLCQPSAFTEEAAEPLPKVINCPDWDRDLEQPTKEKTCPVCALYRLAAQALKELKEEGETEENQKERDYFAELKRLSRYRRALKWNIFDRDQPNVTVVDENGNESKQKGLKIATIGMEAWKDIDGIFQQCELDLTDPENGVDIKVLKGHNGTRVEYSAQVVLDGTTIRVTPFDEEEKKLAANPHDLKSCSGKAVDPEVVRAALHGDYADTLEINSEDDESSSDSSDGADLDALPVDDDTQPADNDDDDALLGGGDTSKKKRR